MKHLLFLLSAFCLLTSGISTAAPLTSNPITANGTYTVPTYIGKRYVFAAAGTFGGGSLAFNWNDGTTSTAYAGSPSTAANTFTFTAAASTAEFVLTGATSPSITVTVALADGQSGLDAKAAKLAKTYRVADYGAKADGITLYDGTFTSGSTAFTSATAAFVQADVGKSIVLQVSQGTRQILTIASVTNSTTIVLSAAASASSSAYTYGITTYGTDNSVAIQAAITAAGQLGGEILLDGGTYLCTAAPSGASNAIFTVPFSATAVGASPSFTFRGVGTPNFAWFNDGQRPALNGTIIYCPNSAGASGVEPAIFAVVPFDWNPGTVPNSVSYWGSTTTMLAFENLTIRQVPATKMHAIQDHLGGAMYINKCAFVPDVPYSKTDNLLINPATGGASACAIIPPSKLSAYWTKIENCYIYGYVTGLRFTDNVALDQVVFEFCDTAMEGTVPYYTNGMTAGALFVWRCRIVLAGHINAAIRQINYEWAGAGGFTPSWAINNTGADIDNYLGHIRGNIGLYVVEGGTGPRAAKIRVAETVTPTTANTLVVHDLVSGKTVGNNVAESLRISPITASPAAPSLATSGTAGSTTYKYKIAYNLPDGSVLLGPEATITTGNATLNSTNKITFPNIPYVAGSCSLKLYRTATTGSATLGLISQWFDPSSNGSNFVTDTGQVGDGVVPVNTSGRVWFTNNSGTWDGANITGAQAFTSSTRPSSAGTGTPNATDLVTLADVDTRVTSTLAGGVTLVNPTITNYTESVVSIGTVTTASTLSFTSGTVQTATLTASTACTFTMPSAVAGKSFTLLLKQAASTGNGTATFTGVKWPAAAAPTITATAGKMDLIVFLSDGASWYGSITQNYTP